MTHPSPFPPPQWQPTGAHAATPPPKTPFWRSKKGAAVLLGVGLLAAAVLTAGNNNDPRPDAAPVHVTTAPSAAPVATPEPAAPAASSGPLTTFSDGTYEIGTGAGQVPPGKYRAAKPDPGGVGTCYAATLQNNDGELGDIVDQKVSQGQVLLNVPKPGTVHYVDVRGCTFTKAG